MRYASCWSIGSQGQENKKFEKKFKKILQKQKFHLSLHSLKRNGGIAQLVRAHDS